MNAVAQNWETILDIIKTEYGVTEIQYNTWLRPLKVVSLEGDVVTLALPPELEGLGLKYIKKRYILPLQVTISDVLGMEECTINFISEKDIPVSAPPEVRDDELERRVKEARINPKYTFDAFVVGSNSKFAQAAALAVAEEPGGSYNPLYIYGGAGLGKTHLMHSIGHFILEHNKDCKILYVTSEEFTNELIETIRNGNNTAMSKFRDKYRNIDVLLLDDIQFIIGKESTQEEFFHTFNTLYSAQKQIVLTSDKPPKDMEILEERFRSRFEWGLIADISVPDYETRMAILHKKEEQENIVIDEEIIQYIANNIKSNIRELEGAFNKIVAHARLGSGTITMDEAVNILKDFISPFQNRNITADDIMEIVADSYNVTVNDLVGSKRNYSIMEPRQVCMYLIREILSLPYKNIGLLLGKRDHTTVINGIKKINNEIETNEQMSFTINSLIKRINSLQS